MHILVSLLDQIYNKACYTQWRGWYRCAGVFCPSYSRHPAVLSLCSSPCKIRKGLNSSFPQPVSSILHQLRVHCVSLTIYHTRKAWRSLCSHCPLLPGNYPSILLTHWLWAVSSEPPNSWQQKLLTSTQSSRNVSACSKNFWNCSHSSQIFMHPSGMLRLLWLRDAHSLMEERGRMSTLTVVDNFCSMEHELQAMDWELWI